MASTNIKLANWNGAFMPIEEVRVSVLDRAFLFGDACYEVIRVYGGHCWNLDEHLDRLAQSLYEVKMHGVDLTVLRDRAKETVRRSALKDALVYVQVSRGSAPRMHRFPAEYSPNQLVWVQDFPDPYADLRKNGASVITFPDIRWRRNDIKSTSLMANCLAATAAHEAGCAEALFINTDGLVTEGSHTSMFAVRGGEILIAPRSRDVLPGITKRMVIELAGQTGTGLREHRLRVEELKDIDELFMTGTPEEIVPIVRVDDFAVGNGEPGPVVRSLQQAFRQCVNDWLTVQAR